MSQACKETQEARSALNTVISSSKKTTSVSSASPPPDPPSPYTPSLLSSNNPGGGRRVRDGLSWVNQQGALMAKGWRAGGQLCCLLGLSPCWAMIKSRPWCEAFCWGNSGFLLTLSLDVSLKEDVTKYLCLLSEFTIKGPLELFNPCCWPKKLTITECDSYFS